MRFRIGIPAEILALIRRHHIGKLDACHVADWDFGGGQTERLLIQAVTESQTESGTTPIAMPSSPTAGQPSGATSCHLEAMPHPGRPGYYRVCNADALGYDRVIAHLPCGCSYGLKTANVTGSMRRWLFFTPSGHRATAGGMGCRECQPLYNL